MKKTIYTIVGATQDLDIEQLETAVNGYLRACQEHEESCRIVGAPFRDKENINWYQVIEVTKTN